MAEEYDYGIGLLEDANEKTSPEAGFNGFSSIRKDRKAERRDMVTDRACRD